jgi:hypothetical protein
MKVSVLVCASALTLTACTGSHTVRPATTHTTNPPTRSSFLTRHQSATALRPPACRTPSPVTLGRGFPEVKGSSKRIQLWGLIMVDGPDNPVHVGNQVKIVWRITGSGELRLTSVAPDGRSHPLQWGPDEHLSGTFRRPGQEWGAGYLFTQPGCWDLHAARGTATADVWLNIAA